MGKTERDPETEETSVTDTINPEQDPGHSYRRFPSLTTSIEQDPGHSYRRFPSLTTSIEPDHGTSLQTQEI